LKFSTVVTKEERLYVAHCPEFDVTSQGTTVKEALTNLREVVELYLEDPYARDTGVRN
jgi:predicted RNase H-like HicB family nuclease